MIILAQQQRLAVKEAYAAFFKESTQASKAHAKSVIADPESAATALFIAAKHLLGAGFVTYEPDTLWLELDPPTPNRDKLMAGIALAMTPSFYWDYRVFGATTHAFTDDPVQPTDVPRCTPGAMAWTAFEAELLFALSDGESTVPDHDPCVDAYVATVLFDEGFVLPPVGLGFCVEELKSYLPKEALVLRSEVESAWSAFPKEKIDSSKFEDNPLGAQLRKLAEAWLYVAERTKLLRNQLEKF